MKSQRFNHLAAILLTVGILVLASCQTEDKAAAPTAEPMKIQSSVTTQPGVAGGVAEDVLTVSAIVSAVDRSTRAITLTGPDGDRALFVAGPEIRNFDQLKVGDKVTATLARRLTVVVKNDGAAPSASATVAAARAVKGDKPGAMAAEEIEIVARVKAIDAVTRTATLEFADGDKWVVPVRSDVDLSKYKPGDTVTARVTTALTLLVAP